MKKGLKTTISLLILCLMLVTFCTSCEESKEAYYSSAEELATKRISIWQGFTYEGFIQDTFPDAEYYYFGDINLMYEALYSSKIDAFAYEECFQAFADKDDLKVSHLSDLNYQTHYGYIFADTEKAQKLLGEMNQFLEEYKSSGKLAVLQNEWISQGETLPLDGINDWDTSAGEVVVSTPASQVPFHYLYNGSFSGYEAALMCEFCKAHNYKLVINVVQWDSMLADVQSGRSDIGIGCIENSESHRESFAMCDSTYDGNFVLYVKSDPSKEPKYKADELNGKTFASVIGTIYEGIVKEKYPDSSISNYQTLNEAIYAVSIGKAEYTLAQQGAAKDAMSKMDGIVYLSEPFYHQEIGAIFNKEDEKSQTLLRQFNSFIDKLKESGELAAMEAKWMAGMDNTELPERSFSGETINIALNPDEVPYGFVKNGDYVGMEVELVEAFCEEYGYTPNFYAVDFTGFIVSVVSTRCDFGLGNLCYTEERAESVDFSNIYAEVPLYIIVQTAGSTSQSFIANFTKSFYRTFIEEDRYKMFIEGILTTVGITLASAILGTILGFAIYLLCRKGNKILNKFFDLFARLMVGLPMVVVLMILYYVIFGRSTLPGSIIAVVGFTASIALSVYSNLKVSVSAIDPGQVEGAYAIGFTDNQTFFRIVLPQAMQTFMPAYKGSLIGLINGTAIVGFIAVQDLTKMSDLIRARTYEAFFPLIATAIIYLILGALLTAIVKRIEFRFEPEKRSEEQILKKYK